MATLRAFAAPLFVSIALVAGLGCSAGSAENDVADESSDNLVETKTRRTTALFQPDEASLVESVPSTFRGIERWDVYESEKGMTVRGVSETKKIKVVYAIPVSLKDGKLFVDGAGYVRAPDFELPQNTSDAMRVLTEALRIDLADPTDTGGVRTQNTGSLKRSLCLGHGLLLQAVAGSISIMSTVVVTSDVCIVTMGAGCLAAAVVAMVAIPTALGVFWICEDREQN